MVAHRSGGVDFEVAVVGAGPAGSTTALACRRWGIGSVALIDKAIFPRDKSCGDGLGPGVVRVMESLDLGEALVGRMPIEALAVSSPSGLVVSGPLPLVGGKVPIGYVIRRYEFDDLLFRAAVRAGAHDLTGCEFKNATYDVAAKVWTLTLARDQDPITIKAKYLVGADGPRSKVRQ